MRRALGKTAVGMKVLISGKEGTRKSNIAIQFARLKKRDGSPYRVLLIDTEYKAIEGFNENYLARNGVDFENVLEARTRNLDDIYVLIDRFINSKPIMKTKKIEKEVIDEITKLKRTIEVEVFTNEPELDADGNPFVADVIIIDSLTIISDLYIDGRSNIVERRTKIKIKNEGLSGDEKELALDSTGLQFLDYAKLTKKAKEMIRDLQSTTGKHVVYVCRAKDDKKMEKDKDGKMVQIDLGTESMSATSFKFLPFETNLNLKTSVNKDGVVQITVDKDCSGLHEKGDVIYDFDILEYQDYINNEHKTEVIQRPKYSEDISVAVEKAEDNDELPHKNAIYESFVSFCNSDTSNKPKVAKFLQSKGLNVTILKSVDMVSLELLLELKEEFKF